MAYAIERENTVEESVRAAAAEQVDKALGDLRDLGRIGPVEAVHDCRKRCKKLRGLVRLVRPSMGSQYGEANAVFRDAARELSSIRDAQSLLGTFDDVVAASSDQLPDGGLPAVRAGLRRRAVAATTEIEGDDDRVQRARRLLEEGRDAIDGWSLADDGWDAIGPGLAKTYARGRKAIASIADAPSPENFHEWRKRAKYTWYHVRLVERAAPSVLVPLGERFHDLADALGDAHDLAVLERQLTTSPEEFGGDEQIEGALIVLRGRRMALEAAARSLGPRLYAEKPGAFVDRLGRYWDTWQALGDELRAGEIADLCAPVDGLEELNVDRLSAMAGEAEIPGRSGMRKADLIGALRVRG
ncbi:CHAD domain-containing protein [Rhabdothermincola salaria]|uniref:CHAD domain-containing protein n=1 Tax=Rhabdothermincola salaria TaxID=2903142 RepID=UPI001E311063|nr:CHAD domain-containing protein [Rhabdothermincola salaria]MCD9624525.1 CHAD domain-containing protein [Rhabdothermincola salaria]